MKLNGGAVRFFVSRETYRDTSMVIYVLVGEAVAPEGLIYEVNFPGHVPWQSEDLSHAIKAAQWEYDLICSIEGVNKTPSKNESKKQTKDMSMLDILKDLLGGDDE